MADEGEPGIALAMALVYAHLASSNLIKGKPHEEMTDGWC